MTSRFNRIPAGLALIGMLSMSFLITTAHAQDWTQFRGTKADAVARNANPPTEWSETKNVRWKTVVPGRGRSSPVVQGDRIWLTTAIVTSPKRETIGTDDMQTAAHIAIGVACLARTTGKLIYHTTFFEIDNPAPVHWYNSWATPTPVVEGGRVFCDYGTYGTGCIDAKTGKELWKKQVPIDHMVGPGSSPAVYKDLLLLVRDGIDAQFVLALNNNTGEQVWKTNRPEMTNRNDQKKAFSTPLVITEGGRAQAVIVGAQWIVSYEPETGKELWRAKHGTGFSFGACPIYGNGLLYFSTGLFNVQVWAMRVDGSGDVTDTHVVWKSNKFAPNMSSPLLFGNELYWVSDSGTMACSDAKTGQLIWQKALGGTYLASPIAVKDRVYVINMVGKATVVKAAKEFQQLAENTLDGPLAATPAIVGNAMYLRTDGALYCIQAGAAVGAK